MLIKGIFSKEFKIVFKWLLLLLMASLFAGTTSHAQSIYVGPIPNDDYKFGRVMARAVVLDPDTGEPILVRFNEDGTEAGVIDSGGESVTEIGIFAAEDYRFFENRLEAYKVQYEETRAKGAELLSRTEYESRDFKAADNETEIVKPTLPQGINSVFVRAQVRRIPKLGSQQSEPDESLILLRFPFDLSQDIEVADSSVSILVNSDGQVIEQSDKRIGYRNGFFGDPNEPQDARRYQVENDDEVFGPVKFAKVYVDEIAYRGGVDTSDNQGKYSFRFYMPLCPLGGFTFTTDVGTDLFYKNFLPIGSPTVPYFVRTPGYTFCDAFLVPAFLAPTILAIQSTNVSFNRQSNLIVDVMFLTGRMEIKNVDGESVPIGDTTYTEFEEEAEDTLQREYDFNRDDQADYVVQGKIEPRTDPDTGEEFSVFVQGEGEEFDKQGIFFDGSQEDEFDFPDLVRVLDQKLRSDEAVGVLKSISAADMRNTDILVFRDSTGQLVMERRGLKEEESEDRAAIQYDPDENEVGFTVMLRGFYDTALNIGGIGSLALRASYEDWATANQLTEPFRTRESDQLRPGEFVKVVAINRATGYMATAKVKLRSANELEGSTLGSTSDLTVAVPKMTLQPPNLKIWAEREYSVEKGITKDEERQYLIGSEGASLTSDTLIRVYTEWLDTEGYPLPRELGLDDGEEYGLTGRLAKVVSENTLSGVNAGSDLAEFAIKPGRETQVIRVASNLSQAEHFYIHVIGKGKDQECVNQSSCPSFNQNGEGLYAGRPALLTPFKVPLFDENTTWLEYRSYRDVLDEFNEEDTVIEERPEQPLPSYVWQYRPEYQFSQYKLEVEEINRQVSSSDPNNPEIIDIIDVENPIISSTDDLVSILYSLVSSQFERLDPIDGEQELILALGEEEQLITIGSDQTITFENLESLGLLEPEDFLTIRLYTNNDAGNILWEYAFYTFGVIVDNNRDGNVDITKENDQSEETVSSISSEEGNEDDGDNSAENPFLFWINNDLDVVDNAGEVEFDELAPIECPPEANPDEQQCEQWDIEYDENNNNTSGNNISRIESLRDLEDFQALMLSLPFSKNEDGFPDLPTGMFYSISVKNININLFRGAWKKGKDYLVDETVMKNQVKKRFDVDGDGDTEAMYLFRLDESHPEELMGQGKINDVFGKSKIARLLFEGISESPEFCVDEPEECYLQVAIKRGSEVLAYKRVYIQLYDIKHFYDHYSAGVSETPTDITVASDTLLFPTVRNIHENGITTSAVMSEPHKFINIHEGRDEDFEDEYIMMVHGWRMRYPERVNFGEVAFKRFFHLGYKGRFGLYSWPTGWFEKPAYIYPTDPLSILSTLGLINGNQQNYGNSEVVARASGVKLVNLLSSLSLTKRVNIFAHSMGNVVVSEALKTADPQKLVDTYIASQAAESSGAYNQDSRLMKFLFYDATPEGVERAWRRANFRPIAYIDSEYAMPPNLFTYSVPEIHGATVPRFERREALQEGWGANYYSSISTSGSRIVNFFNPQDAALDAWEINQMTKPDFADGSNWTYDFKTVCAPFPSELICDPSPDIEDDEMVRDIFLQDGQPIDWDHITPVPVNENMANILGHIVPSRTGALGQGAEIGNNSIIDSAIEWEFGASNQGHSAQYYNTFLSRCNYWLSLLVEFNENKIFDFEDECQF